MDSKNADRTQSMFVLTFLEKMKKYEETRDKLTNTELNKLKSAAKNKI